MTMATNSREAILENIRSSTPRGKVAHPAIPAFKRAGTSLIEEFELHLRQAGGSAQPVANAADAEATVTELHPDAEVICSAVPEIAGTRSIGTVRGPHELAHVDVGIVRARFGVAESGAVWLTEEDLVFTALGFLSQHLVVLLDPEQIVADMHEAYRRVELEKTAFGCFMMGPSATADVEATLVHGAQGPRSLNVLFLAQTTGTAI